MQIINLRRSCVTALGHCVRRYACSASIFLLSWLIGLTAVAQEVRFPGGVTEDDRRWDYITDLLQLVLDKTSGRKEQTLLSRLPAMTEARRIAELQARRLDVAFGLASTKLENSGVYMIPIPLQKGLAGWRLLLVTPLSAPLFTEVKDLPSLQPLRGGFSSTFADFPVMLINGLNIIPGSVYLGLFEMLRRGRSDYFSRGVGEVYLEVASKQGGIKNSLLIQPSIALHYPADMVFIIDPKNPGLAARIEKGLRQAIKDGSRDRLFQQYFAADLERAAINNRTVIEMQNPFLPASIDVTDKSLWWRPSP